MDQSKTHKLILVNDDENSYLYVMACLMKYCDHEREQAEQSAIITNNNGECHIKSGSFLDMFELKNQLDSANLNVRIEEYASDLY